MGIGLDRVPAGAKEYASEFISAPPSGPASGSVLRLWSSDRGISFRLPSSIGELDAFILNVVWLYASPTDVASLRASVIALVDHMPFLAGRRSTAVVGGARVPVVTLEGAAGVRFSHRAGAPGSAKTYAGDEHVEPERGLLADMATLRGVRRMSEPLFTVRVTNFQDGTSSVGICCSHALADGLSFFEIVKALAAGHAGGEWRCPSLQRDFALIPAIPLAEVPRGAIRLSAWWYTRLVSPLVVWLFRGMFRRPRARLHLTAAEVGLIKGGARLPDGTSPSTNEALSALLAKALGAELRCTRETRLGMVVGMRGRGVFAPADKSAGNFSGIVLHRLRRAPQDTPLPELVAAFRGLGDRLRDPQKLLDTTARWSKVYALQEPPHDAFAPRMIDPELSLSKLPLSLNNQMGFAWGQVEFGAGPCTGVIPWHSGPDLHIIARPTGANSAQHLSGGVDVYFQPNPSRIRYLEGDAFKAKLMALVA